MRLLLALVLVFLVPAAVFAAPPDLTAAVDAYVEKELTAFQVPGAAWAIVKGDQVVHARGFGTMTPDSPVPLGSISKSITAVAVMQLVEAGKVKLDEPVKTYIPELAVAEPITIRQLLVQTTGFSNADGRRQVIGLPGMTLEARLKEFSSYRLLHVPGAKWEYSNLNYTLLSLVVQRVSQQSFQQYVTTQIFGPLGMTHSFASQDAARAAGMPTGHVVFAGYPRALSLPYPEDAIGAAYLIASASDLARYVSANLSGGGEVLSAPSVALMHQPAVPAKGDSFYGMGWYVEKENGIVRHAGTLPNYHADVVMDTRSGWGVVLLSSAHNMYLGNSLEVTARNMLRLVNGEPVTEEGLAYHKTIRSLNIGMIVTLLLTLTLPWLLGRLRRRLVRGAASVVGRLVIPVVLCLGLAVAVWWAVPVMFDTPWRGAVLFQPDLGYLLIFLITMLGVAAVWHTADGVVRLRRPGGDATRERAAS